jgi:hypothetical protein
MSIKKISIAVATSIMLATAAVAPAQATGFAVSADKTSALVAAGDTVNVTITDLPTNTGVYVRLCAGTVEQALVGRPADCFGQGSWATNNSAYFAYGAVDAANPVALAVQAQFTANGHDINCLTQACGIHIRRDHLNGTDYSLDRFIPLTFTDPNAVVAPPSTDTDPTEVATPVVAPKTGVSHSPGKVTFTFVNKKGKTVTVFVGTRRVVKKIPNNNYKLHVVAPTRGWFNAIAYIGGVKILSKKFTN